MTAHPSDYKTYCANLYYTNPSACEGKAFFMLPIPEYMKQFLYVADADAALAQALSFAKAHPDFCMKMLCVVTSFYTKKENYNYRTDYQWYRWDKASHKFERDEYQKDVHW